MRRTLLATTALAAAALLAAGCGGDDTAATTTEGTTTEGTTTEGTTTEDTTTTADDGPFLPDLPEPTLDDTNRFSRGSSVGEGDIPAPAPPIAAAVKRAADAAGCTVKGFPSEGRQHVEPDAAPDYGTQPPTSGNHFITPAKYGVYDEPVPDMPTVHALEHGANVIYVGKEVPASARTEIGRFWAESPPYMLVMPGRSKDFPAEGIVVTSWQRWLVCKPFQAGDLAAVKAFRDEYRGTGPEGVAGLHNPGDVGFPGTPEPLVVDPGAAPAG
jgi:Protein of unknown function (DUF3105)